MANPVSIVTPAGQWTKVVTNKTTADVYIMDSSPTQYVQTIRDTGATAPDAADAIEEGFQMPTGDPYPLRSSVARDMYIWCYGSDGRVRVDV